MSALATYFHLLNPKLLFAVAGEWPWHMHDLTWTCCKELALLFVVVVVTCPGLLGTISFSARTEHHERLGTFPMEHSIYK